MSQFGLKPSIHRHSRDFHDVLQLVFVVRKLRSLPEILNLLGCRLSVLGLGVLGFWGFGV